MTRLPTPLRPLFPLAKRGVVLTTELAGPVTRRLPDRGGRAGPPRHMAASTPAYALTHPGAGVEVVEVLPRQELSRPHPSGLPPDHFSFAHHSRVTVPPAIVARVPGGRAVGHYGAVVTADDTLLFDLSPYYGAFRPAQHPIFLSLRLPPREELEGTVGVLTTRGVDNYYHFLIDVLPRLELVRLSGLPVDRYLVNTGTPFQRELLDLLGIGAGLVVESAGHPHVRAEQLVVPSLPDNHLGTPPWVAAWLRRQFLPPAIPAPHRRLYVTRGRRRHTRHVVNEDAVVAALAPYGFEVVDPGTMTVADQVRAFSEAALVVGAHGAALTNIVFCPEGAAVVELFPPDYVNVCYWSLASAVGGLRYRYLVGDGLPSTPRPMHGVASDITVDPGLVARLVAQVA